jgi:hypothetical protein
MNTSLSRTRNRPWGLLEPDAWKAARPVLRGRGRSNALPLPGASPTSGCAPAASGTSPS